MRYLVLLVALLVALVAAAVFGLMSVDVTLDEVRDIVIIAYGVMGVLLLFTMMVAVVGFVLIGRELVRMLRELLEDPVRPILNEARETARNVRGASEFIADSTVHPLIRTISAVRGARRGISTLVRARWRSRR